MEGSQRPIILLLGAKSLHRPLPAIPEELSTLKTIFEAHQTGTLPQYDIKYEPFFTQKHLKTWLDDFADHIAILHFAGHSDSSSIQTDDSVVRAEDIAAHINTWTRRPDLVFLNGCQNQSQAQTFLDAGVSAVVATQRAVDDKLAANFAREYYHSLLAQNGNTSLTAALEQAKAKLGFEQNETSRSLDIDEGTTQANSWNWDLFLKDTEQAHLSLHKLLTLNRPQYDDAGKLITPYQGLAAFKEEDQDFFFGREQLTGQLVNTIEETPFLVLLGSSGSGKSSLINAGIIPKLRLTKDYLIFKTRPGNDPFAEIARCITQHLYPEKSQLSQRLRESKQLTADYQLNPEHLAEFLQVCLQESGKRRLVLFIDQFEELFTHSDSEAAKVAVKQYETALAELVTNAADTVTLVLVMRADFLGIALTHQTLATLLDRYSQYSKYLSPMSSAELRSVILQPAAKQGVSIENGLADQLLTELEKNTESLPLLQHVLSLLWQSRDSSTLTLVDYTRLGGIETALETQADQFLDSLDSSEQREQVKRIFLRLINLGEGQDDTRRRADMAEFGTEPNVEILLQKLAEQRLVATQGDDSQNAFVEVSHEALIRSWSRLKEWINEDRDQLRIQHQVSKAAKDWAEHEYEESWLLSGSRLAAADEWLNVNESIASESEKRLLRTSKAKEKRKKNRIVSAVTVVIALLTCFAVFAGFQWDAARTSAEDARQKERQAVEEKLNANYNLAKAFEEKSLFSTSRGDEIAQEDTLNPKAIDEYRNAILYALEAQKRPLAEGKIPILSKSLGQVSALQSGILNSSKLETPRLEIGYTTTVAYSPDGKTIASSFYDNTVKDSTAIKLWNAKSFELINTLKGHSSPVWTLTYSPDGKFIASGSDDNTIRLWDTQSGETIDTLEGHSNSVSALAYSPDGKVIASGSEDNIRLWNISSGVNINTIKGHKGTIQSLAYSPDGKTIASGSSGDEIIRLWSTESGKAINTLKGHQSSVLTLAYSPDGKVIASGSDDQTIRLWDVNSAESINILNGHLAGISTLAYSPNGNVIASGSGDSTIRLWDALSGELIEALKGHSDTVRKLDYSSDGKIIISVGDDRAIRLWNAQSGEALHGTERHSDAVTTIAYSPNGKIIASGSKDNTIRLWTAQSLELIKTLNPSMFDITTIAFSPNGKVIASGASDNTIRLWNTKSGLVINTLEGHSDTVSTIAYSPNCNLIASGSHDKTIRLWDTQSGEMINVLKGHTEEIEALTFSPDGMTIASGSRSGTIRLWNLQSGKTISSFKESNAVKAIAYSPNGEVIASASDSTVRLWDLQSKKIINTLKGHASYVFAIAYSPDGENLAVGSWDNLRIWNIKSGKVTDNRIKNSGIVSAIAYSPDGKSIASGSADSTIRLWNSQPSDTINILKSHSQSVDTIEYSPDGKVMLIESDNNVELLNLQTGKIIHTIKDNIGWRSRIAYSPNGKVIASLGRTTFEASETRLQIWDIESSKLINTLKVESLTISAITFSPDSKTIASISDDNIIRIWNIQSGEIMKTLTEHSDNFAIKITYSPDGQFIASASGNTITIWNVESGEEVHSLIGHSDTIYDIAYSVDGKVIASGSRDKTIRLWNTQSGKTAHVLNGHSAPINSIAFSHDGKFIASASNETVHLWDTLSGKPINTLNEHSAGVFTIAFSPDDKVIASGSGDGQIRFWQLTNPLYRFIHDFEASEVSGALRFLWELELEDLNFKHTPRPPSLFPQLGYHIAWTDETRKFRPLLDMPEGDDSKMDQVVKWLEKRCAYKHPERYDCTPIKD